MAKREEEAEPAVVEAPVEKKSRKKLVLGLVLVVLAGTGAGAWTMWHGHAAPAATGKTKAGKVVKPVEHQPELYLALDPAFVVNFRDDQSMRFLQVGVSLMSHDQAALDVAKSADPVIRNELLMLFSRQDYAILSDPVGKQKLQAQALVAVRKIVGDRLGRPGIDALYFTSFVMQ